MDIGNGVAFIGNVIGNGDGMVSYFGDGHAELRGLDLDVVIHELVDMQQRPTTEMDK